MSHCVIRPMSAIDQTHCNNPENLSIILNCCKNFTLCISCINFLQDGSSVLCWEGSILLMHL
jgi:hypothetical protein